MLAEVIAHGDGGFRDRIASELVCEIRHIVQVELRADEEVVRERDLQTGSQVDLEMSGAADGRSRRRAHGGSDAATLRDDETGAGAADSGLQLHDGAFGDEGLIDAIHIDEGLAVLERAVVLMRGLEVDFRADAEMLAEHDVAAEAQEEAVQLGRCQAKWTRNSARTPGESVVLSMPEAGGGIPGGAEVHVYIQGALRVGENGEESKGKQTQQFFRSHNPTTPLALEDVSGI